MSSFRGAIACIRMVAQRTCRLQKSPSRFASAGILVLALVSGLSGLGSSPLIYGRSGAATVSPLYGVAGPTISACGAVGSEVIASSNGL